MAIGAILPHSSSHCDHTNSAVAPTRAARILLVADTHLGIDLPLRPRVKRRRRGNDFFANLDRALQPAMRGEADVVIHGGDLLDRSKAPAWLVEMAIAPLCRVADTGIPVFLVPGNHERSRIPRHLWLTHPGLHIFEEPRTFVCRTPAATIALSGFPFVRRVRDDFINLVQRTGHDRVQADVHVLCVHQTFEGAQVGPSDYTFRGGPDVIRGKQIPTGFACVLGGHIHRSQVLTRDLHGRALSAPIVYPGSVERTSFAERFEQKHYALLRVEASGDGSGRLASVSFVPLPARPMVSLDIRLEGRSAASLDAYLRERLSRLDPESVVRIRLAGDADTETRGLVTAARLRALAPATMNISLAPSPRLPKQPSR